MLVYSRFGTVTVILHVQATWMAIQGSVPAPGFTAIDPLHCTWWSRPSQLRLLRWCQAVEGAPPTCCPRRCANKPGDLHVRSGPTWTRLCGGVFVQFTSS